MPVQIAGITDDWKPAAGSLKHVVTTGAEFESMMHQLRASTSLIFDFETSGLRWYGHSRPCGLALGCWNEHGQIVAWYVPYRHDTGEVQLSLPLIAPAFKELLENPHTLKIAHNLKFDEHMAHTEGWQVCGERYDTMVGAKLINENERTALKFRAGLDLARGEEAAFERKLTQYVHRLAKSMKLGKEAYMNKYGYSQVPINLLGTYACLDIDFTGSLCTLYESRGMRTKYPRIWPTEMALTGVLCEMEENGLPVDAEYLESLRFGLEGEMESLNHKIEQSLGKRIHLSKDAHLRGFLYGSGPGEMGLTPIKYTKTGQESVDADVLEHFAASSPLIGLIAEWRTAHKLHSTYTKSILDHTDDRNIVHGQLQSVGTDTGRMSSKEPNLQNFASDNEDRAIKHSGKKLKDGGVDPWSIKRAFVNRGTGWVRILFDYSQVELRVLAYYSQDKIMTDAYLKGEDIHTRTSMEVFGTADDAKRRMAKCFHPDTEVLTKRGWVRIPDLAEGEQVIQALPRDNYGVDLEWATPTDVFTQRHPSKELLHLRNEGIDLKVTPDHRMLTWGSTGKCKDVLAEYFGNQRGWANAGIMHGGDLEVPERLLRLAVATQADGSFTGPHSLRFGFSKKRKIDRLRSLLVTGEFNECKLASGVTTFYVKQELGTKIRALLTHDKTLPWAWVNLTYARREVVLDEASYWDSTRRVNWLMYRYSSVVRENTDVLQAIAAITGRKSRVTAAWRQGYAPCLNLTIRRKSNSRGENVTKQRLPYSDKVACLSVPSTYVLVRYNGVTVITGQTVNFGLSYCLSAGGLARQAKMPLPEAEDFMRKFFDRYHGIVSFREQFWSQVRTSGGYFENLFGRSRRVPGINSFSSKEAERCKRQAIGSLIQGTAAELTKESLVRIHNWFKAEKIPALIVTTIHDEIQVDVPVEYVAQVAAGMKSLMEAYPEFAPIPIIAEGSYTNTNWAEKKKLP